MKKLRDLEHVKELVRGHAKLAYVVAFYDVELRKSGSDTLKACCPFHQEKTPSFGISISKQLFHCFGCHEGGDVFEFVQKMESLPWGEAVRRVAEIAKFDLSPYETEQTPEERAINRLYQINADTAQQCQYDINYPNAQQFIRDRFLDVNVLDRYNIGYCGPSLPGGSDGTLAELQALGLMDLAKWENSLVFPVRDEFGRVAGFRRRMLGSAAGSKANAPQSSHPLSIPPVYGVFEAKRAIRERGYAICVEGEIDCIQMASYGWPNTLALCGTKLGETELRYLESIGITKLVVMADGDKAGREFSARLARQKNPTKVSIKIARLDDGDPDEILLRDGSAAVTAAIGNAKYAFEYYLDDVLMRNPIQYASDKIDVLNEVKDHVGSFREYERDLIVSTLSQKLGMADAAIADFFKENESVVEPLHNLRSERIILRRMLDDSMFLGEAITELKPADFFLTKNRTVFEAAAKFHREGEIVNADTIRTYLTNRGATQAAEYVSELLKAAESTDAAEYLLSDLRDKSLRRSMQRECQNLLARLADTSIDSRETIQGAAASMAHAVSGGRDTFRTSADVGHSVVSVMHDRIRNPNAIIGLDLGGDWRTLNSTIHGLQAGRYFVLAAPSSVGKSAAMCSFARRIAIDLGEPTTILTFETSPETLATRIIAAEAGVEIDRLVTGMVREEEAQLIQDSAGRFAASPLLITTKGRSIEEAVSLIRHDVMKRGTKLVCLDYLQLMHMSNKKGGMARHEEVGNISTELISLSQELNISILALAQINRAGAKSGAATMEDMGDSYRISQDADHVMIMRIKSDEELDAFGRDAGDCHAVLDKNRHGKDKVTFHVIRDMPVGRIYQAPKSF